MKQTCRNCKYWKECENNILKYNIGDCRRFPKNERMYDNEWCGEWKKKILG